MNWWIKFESGFEASYSGNREDALSYANSMVYRFGDIVCIEEY